MYLYIYDKDSFSADLSQKIASIYVICHLKHLWNVTCRGSQLVPGKEQHKNLMTHLSLKSDVHLRNTFT